MVEIQRAEAWIDIAPHPNHQIVDIDGTLLPFRGLDRTDEALAASLRGLIGRQRPNCVVVASDPGRERSVLGVGDYLSMTMAYRDMQHVREPLRMGIHRRTVPATIMPATSSPPLSADERRGFLRCGESACGTRGDR